MPPPPPPEEYRQDEAGQQQGPPPPPAKPRRTGVIIVILVIIVICAFAAFALIFDLFGLRTMLGNVIPAFAPAEESSMVSEPEESALAVSRPEPSQPEPEPSQPEESEPEPEPEPEPTEILGYSVRPAIDFQFASVTDFDENGLARVQLEPEGPWGVIDIDGRWVTEPVYDWIYAFYEGYALVEYDEMFGLIDIEGAEVIAPQWEDAYTYGEGLMPVAQDGRYGYIDLDGNVIIPLQYDDAFTFSDGYGLVRQGANYAFITRDGTISDVYQNARSFSEGQAAVMQGGQWGFIDHNFYLTVPCIYRDVWDFHDGVAIAQLTNEKQVLIDSLGNQLSPELDLIYQPNDGFAIVAAEEYYGLFDIAYGDFAITPQYGDMYLYAEGFVPVTLDMYSWFYVDTSDYPRIEGDFDEARPFYEGIARVRKGGYWALIDSEGNELTDYNWASLGICSQGLCTAYDGEYWGYLRVEEE